MNAKSLSFGFTLIELLVVITIIGILVSLGTVSYSTTQKKARNSRRMQDLKAIQSAFEQYYADNSGSYPTTGCDPGTTYLPAGMPTDPKTGVAYSPACPTPGVNYRLSVPLEGTTTEGNASNTSCGSYGNCDTNCTHFCVKSLQ